MGQDHLRPCAPKTDSWSVMWVKRGAVGILAGDVLKIFCLPLSIQIHDGDGAISGWLKDEYVSHAVQMLRDSFRAARYIGMSLLVLDRYFLTTPMFYKMEDVLCARPRATPCHHVGKKGLYRL